MCCLAMYSVTDAPTEGEPNDVVVSVLLLVGVALLEARLNAMEVSPLTAPT